MDWIGLTGWPPPNYMEMVEIRAIMMSLSMHRVGTLCYRMSPFQGWGADDGQIPKGWHCVGWGVNPI